MGVFTFVCRANGNEWCGKQLSGEVQTTASSTYELQRKLVNAVLSVDSSASGGVQSSFSLVTPTSAVFQVIVGGGVGSGFVGGVAIATSGGGAAAASASPPSEEKKEENEEESDEDMGFSLFD